ncbi:hypothetical protein CCY99_07495 [Helicobacter sp. 16-1353]|uniref:aminotransferase class V-fold PLP-dependent enzyme n=1 Tax=Helicobacter sp. 16-1353 TaxID=2004996 RepID=UPI000DCD9F3B|nr:aminotransferase class V-fold PLP-dependent enzyme [Helicobacter sp. 16-1353]RAX52481.1 hypothetical protein CCY99_07495 [Helicobacter sp. 16-1353]
MIYLDNAATSFPKPQCVAESMLDFTTNIGASAGRAAYKSSISSSRLLHATRRQIAELVGFKNPSRIFFTYNATYAINFALYGILRQNDKVLITQIEHNAIMRPLKFLESSRNIELREIPVSQDLRLDLQKARELAKGVRLIACVGGNNVTGAILPLDELRAIARESGAILLVDATQLLGVYPFSSDGIDIICGNAHKGLLAPMGVGFCVVGENVEFESLVFGGTGSKSWEITQPNFMPDKFESGTHNMHGISGLNSSLAWLKNYGIENIFKKENELRTRLEVGLRGIPKIKIIEVFKGYQTTGILSFTCPNLSKMADLLDRRFDICVRAGLHCSPMTHKSIGTYSIDGNTTTNDSYNLARNTSENPARNLGNLSENIGNLAWNLSKNTNQKIAENTKNLIKNIPNNTHKKMLYKNSGTIRLSPGVFTTSEDIDFAIEAIKIITKEL